MKPDHPFNKFDLILEELGQWKKYNISVYILLSLALFFSGMSYTEFVFIAEDIDYRCEVPECGAMNNSDWVAWAIPSNEKRFDKCHRYSNSKEMSLSSSNLNSTYCTADSFDKKNIVECKNYTYFSKNSIVNTFNLGCKDWMRTLVGSMRYFGLVFGIALVGILSDRIGRKKCLIFTCASQATIGIVRSFSFNYEMFLALEFLETSLSGGLFMTVLIMGIEITVPRSRAKVIAILLGAFTFGIVTPAIISSILSDWRTVLRVMYIPSIMTMMNIWLLDESVRWLLSKGRDKEALEIITKMAKINDVQLSEASIVSLRLSEDEEALNISLTERNKIKPTKTLEQDTNMSFSTIKRIVCSRVLFMRLLVCIFLDLSGNFVYNGLGINSVALSGNKYVNFIMVGLVSVPSNVAAIFLVDRIGRRRTLCFSCILTGIFCITQAYVSKDLGTISLLLYLAGKFFNTFVMFTISIFIPEVFPTSLRQSLYSIVTTVGLIGNISAPQVPLLAKYMESLPSIIFAVMAFTSGILSLTLPETNNRKLPDTIDEAEGIS